MTYTLTVYGYDSGLNELLSAKVYDYRTRKYRNPVKNKNDEICKKAIVNQLPNIEIAYPIEINYHFYAKNKKRDRSNYGSAFIKSFEDALQKAGVILNDGWDDVLTPMIAYDVDSKNPRVEVEIVVRDDLKKRR